jgi:hypothetical protein
MSQFDDHSGSAPARAHKMSAESFVAALAANVNQMSAEALKAYVVNTLPLVGDPSTGRAAGGHGGGGQFGDH